MIGWLRGRLIEQDLDGTLLVDVGGVGYELAAPLDTVERAARDEHGAMTLFVHTHVREDALSLFGFATPSERSAFRTLIGVSHVGPKLALAVLSAVRVDELVEAVESGTSGRLQRIPGIGKKTAERIVLELKGKLKRAAPLPARDTLAQPNEPRDTAMVLGEALVRMGFKPAEADRAVATVGPLDRPLGELVRQALAVLAP